MLDEAKIRVMTRLAAYEEGAGKKYMPVAGYFRGDFISLQLILSFICGTVAFLVVVGLLLFCNFETILSEIYNIDLVEFVQKAGKIYLICLGIYLLATYAWSVMKFQKAKRSVNSYIAAMDKLSKKYYE